MKPFIKDLTINCPCILYNGAVIYDLKKQSFIKVTFIDNKHLYEPLKEILKKYRDLCLQIFTQGKIYIVNNGYVKDPVVIRENQPYETVRIDDVAGEKWVKLMLYDTNEVLNSIYQFLNNNITSGIIKSVFSSPTYLELLPYGISKGSALLDIMRIMNVERDRVIAIGDYCNDIEMIENAGLGVATANAHPLVKKAANITTVSNDEHAIYHLLNKVIPDYERVLKNSKKTLFLNNNRVMFGS